MTCVISLVVGVELLIFTIAISGLSWVFNREKDYYAKTSRSKKASPVHKNI